VTCSFYIKCTPANDRKVCTKMLAIHTHKDTHSPTKKSFHTHTHTRTPRTIHWEHHFVSLLYSFFLYKHTYCAMQLCHFPMVNLSKTLFPPQKKNTKKIYIPKSVKIFNNVNVYVYRNLWTLLYFYIKNQVFSTNLLNKTKKTYIFFLSFWNL